jgi:hypothetical protein
MHMKHQSMLWERWKQNYFLWHCRFLLLVLEGWSILVGGTGGIRYTTVYHDDGIRLRQ